LNKKAVWIWYPGDFEIVLANSVMTRRYERDVFIPPFWRTDDCYHNVKFIKEFALTQVNNIKIKAEGSINILLNDNYVYDFTGTLTLPPGQYKMVITCYNPNGLPALFAEGEEVVSDLSWDVTCNDHRTVKVKTSSLVGNNSLPNTVRLPVEICFPVQTIPVSGHTVYDFGKEIMAYVQIEGLQGKGDLCIYYGESIEEATDFEHTETYDRLKIENGIVKTEIAKAFRYLVIDTKLEFNKKISAYYEYLPLSRQSSFKSSNPMLDAIYQTALHTLHLNTREFMLDGIKRDRWLWSGDAYQSYLMNYYSFFDKEVVRRTMLALFGKLPVATHINHIMDYSFYWIIAFYEYYLYTGDGDFIKENFDKIIAMIDFCRGRTNANGLMEGLPGDWVFVDWADLDNAGEVCFEQMLFYCALSAVEKMGRKLNLDSKVNKYKNEIKELKIKIDKFWDAELGAFIHSYKDGQPDNTVTKHANIIALFYDLCGDDRKEKIKNNVLLNAAVPVITTPYMRFYELAALCKCGEYDLVFDEILSYWGGMLAEGATSFWETFDNTEIGAEKYAMYGRSYGKSLCHAWGASPLYLLGKYFIGLRPKCPGYQSFELRPQLGRLTWFETKIPLNEGYLEFYYSKEKIKIYCESASGLLVLPGQRHIAGAVYSHYQGETLVEIEKATEYELDLK